MIRQAVILMVLTIILVILWDHVLLSPIKILVVFFHESSHALVALSTGGQVHEMVISADQSGHMLSSGGNRFLTLNAGYLGSLLWGMLIYFLAAQTQWDRATMFSLGGVIGIMTLLFVRNPFGMLYGLLASGLMLTSAKYLSKDINDSFLRLIGMTNLLYVPLDIYSDTITHTQLKSDARMLAEEFGGTTVMWGSLWLVLSLILLTTCIRWTLTQQAPSQKA